MKLLSIAGPDVLENQSSYGFLVKRFKGSYYSNLSGTVEHCSTRSTCKLVIFWRSS